MVGVPRSHGCLSCRRSRLKCDEAKPACQRCISKGKACEGYQRFSTFVHRSADGTERRERLGDQPILSTQTDPPPPTYNPPTAVLARPKQVASSDEAASTNGANREYYSALVERFMSIWLPLDPANRSGPNVYWVSEVAKLSDPDLPLRTALHALAANCVGAVGGNTTLLDQGQQKYGQALGLLNSQLAAPGALNNDQTLAAARILMMYELFASPNKSVVGWDAHQRGLFNLATTRGPQSFDNRFGDALLLDIKNVNMIRVDQSGDRSNFLDPQWRRPAVPQSLYEVDHKLAEHLFEMIVFVGELEAISGLDEAAVTAMKALLPKFEEFCSKASTLLRHLSRFQPRDGPSSSGDFWDLPSAILAAYIILMHFRACQSAGEIIETLLKSSMISDAERWQLESLISAYSGQSCDKLGARVLAAIEYCTQDEMGLYGAQKTLFPLRVLMVTVRKGAPYRGKVVELYNRVTTSKGLKHAQDLDNFRGKSDERA